MINLLPPSEKDSLKAEEKFRLMAILFSIAFFFLISFFLILFSLKIYLFGQSQQYGILVSSVENQFQNSQRQKLAAEIASINEDMVKLDAFYKKQPSFTGFLEKISKIIPSGIKLNSLSLDKNKIVLSGYSPTREILFEFKKRLEGEPAFEEIFLPPASWVTPENFTATFKIKI